MKILKSNALAFLGADQQVKAARGEDLAKLLAKVLGSNPMPYTTIFLR